MYLFGGSISCPVVIPVMCLVWCVARRVGLVKISLFSLSKATSNRVWYDLAWFVIFVSVLHAFQRSVRRPVARTHVCCTAAVWLDPPAAVGIRRLGPCTVLCLSGYSAQGLCEWLGHSPARVVLKGSVHAMAGVVVVVECVQTGQAGREFMRLIALSLLTRASLFQLVASSFLGDSFREFEGPATRYL